MDRHIARYSFWIGMACVVVGAVWRAMTVVWVDFPEHAHGLWFSSFRNAGMQLILISIAAVCYRWLQQQTPPR